MGLKIPQTIPALYSGILGNMITMVPITALRVICSDTIYKHLTLNAESINEKELMVSGLLGGLLPSLISSPIEYIRSNQLKSHTSLYLSSIELYKKHSINFPIRGLASTALRDSIYTFGFFSLPPLIEEKIKPLTSDSPFSTTVAGLISGAISAVISHPLDSIKTEQQFKYSRNVKATQVAYDIYSNNGIYGFFKGGTPRITRVISATAIIPTTINYMNLNFK